jgi:DNA-binding transcriptional regulator PaaX
MNTQTILDALKKAKKPTEILLGIFLGGGFNYRQFKNKAFYPTLPDFSKKERAGIDEGLLKKERHKFYSLLSQLKKQGFVEKQRTKNKIYWKITALGEKRLEKLKNFRFLPKINYKKEKDNGINIIVYDIPEKKRALRDWIRTALIVLEFDMIQKSVWIGKNQLPEEFLKSLAELGLIDYVHVFRVTKTGA